MQILGKAEFLNPGGSIKDRVALAIVHEAFEQGRLRRGGLITEGSAGALQHLTFPLGWTCFAVTLLTANISEECCMLSLPPMPSLITCAG